MGDWYGFNNANSISMKDYNSKSVYDNKYSNSAVDQTEVKYKVETSRIARSNHNELLDNSNTYITETISPELLGDFLTSDNQKNINSYNVVNSLGHFITEDIKQMIGADGSNKFANDDITKVSDSYIASSSSFKGYVKGLSRDGSDSEIVEQYASSDDVKTKASTSTLGLSLGEATVINPMHQYNKRTDPRTSPFQTQIGRMYRNNVIAKTPIVLIQPGRVKYNNGFTKMLGLGCGAAYNEMLIRNGGGGLFRLLQNFTSVVTDVFSIVGTLASGVFGNNKLIEFKQDYNLFKKYAMNLFQIVASDMGLLDGSKYVGKYHKLNLDTILPGKNLFGGTPEGYQSNQYIPFRCGKGITSSENFSNSMSASPLEESMNATSEENNTDATGGMMNTFLSGGNIKQQLNTIMSKTATILSSGLSERGMIMSGKTRVSLPEVWSSSNFSRSFGFSFKFHSPYGDDISVFENCYIPFLTLLTMTLPRQTGKMSYTTPFALRLNVKSLIMINFGIVESLNVTRGDDVNDWTPTGYPKTLNVELSVKDLEPNIALPLGSRGPVKAFMEQMFPSSGISEYLFSLGSLTISDIRSFKSRWKRASDTFAGQVNAMVSWDSIMGSVSNSSVVSNFIQTFSGVANDNNNDLAGISSEAGKYAISVASASAPEVGPDFIAIANGYATTVGSGTINEEAQSYAATISQIETGLMDSSSSSRF